MSDRALRRAMLGVFALATATGVLFRLASAYGWTLGLDPINIRHGHSHLMYFGWLTPAFMLAMARQIGGDLPIRTVWAVLGLSLVAFVPFLLYGYESAPIGAASIPLSVIAASANMVAWYFFARWYWTARRRNADESSGILWDVAVGFMLLASAGAWVIALTVPLGVESAVVKAVLAHAFLDWFSGGWFVFAALGLAMHGLGIRVPRWAVLLAVVGTLSGFLLGLPSWQTTVSVRAFAKLNGVVGAIGLLGLVYAWWRVGRARKAWVLPMWLLALLGAGRIGAMLVPGLWWADIVPMRILYVHVLVLGFGTLAAAATLLEARARRVFAFTVLLVLASLVPGTELWPLGSDPLLVAKWMAWVAPLPGVVALWAAVAGRIEG